MASEEIHWKPMTGGRRIPSQLPSIIFKMIDSENGIFYRYKELNKFGFIRRSWQSDYGPRFPTMDGLPVLEIEE